MAQTMTPDRTKEEMKPQAQGTMSSVKENLKEAGSNLMDKGKDVTTSVSEKAKDAASTVAHTVGDAASAVGHKAEDATSAVGGGLRSLAGTIREHMPQEGVAGSASTAVAKTLESSGRYLQEEGLKGIGEDLTNVIRKNPIPSFLVGIGIGFLIARSLRSS